MAVTAQLDPHELPAEQQEESFIHFAAREARLALRWVVIGSAATTALLMFTVFPWAIIPAIALLISYSLYLAASAIERRSYHAGDPIDLSEAEETELQAEAEAVAPAEFEKREINRAAQGRRFTITVEILLGVAALALVTAIAAGFIFGGQLLALGALILFPYMLLIAAPVWLGCVEDEAEDEAHRVEEALHAP